MDLSFEINIKFALSLDINAWKPVYPLSLCVFHVQVRTVPNSIPIIYSWSSNPLDNWGNGTITYTDLTGSSVFLCAVFRHGCVAHLETMRWDLALIFSVFVKILTGGAFVITSGITRE